MAYLLQKHRYVCRPFNVQIIRYVSSNGRHYGPIFFKPEKNLEFFRLKNWPIDGYPGRLE